MATYEYRCDEHGAFEVTRPVGTARASITCPTCDGDARRVFSAPMLFSLPRELVAAVDHADKSRTDPEVVTSLPPKPAHQRTPVLPLTPKLRRLPRP